MNLKIKIANREVPVQWDNQSAVNAIMNKLSANKRIPMAKNGDRQIGELGISIPRNDRALIVKPGDIAVMDGSKLVIFAAEDDVSCTKLGHISGWSESQIKNTLTPGGITVELFEK